MQISQSFLTRGAHSLQMSFFLGFSHLAHSMHSFLPSLARAFLTHSEESSFGNFFMQISQSFLTRGAHFLQSSTLLLIEAAWLIAKDTRTTAKTMFNFIVPPLKFEAFPM